MRSVTIAGAGLAGLTLGHALQQAGVPTTIHEAHTLPRHRVCGEFICGRGAETLQQLGLKSSLLDAQRHRHIQWSRAEKIIYQSELPEPAYGISRYSLDQRLAERFRELGGQLIENSRISTNTEAEGFISCHGRQASPSDWIGLKLHSRKLTTQADLELHLGRQAYLGLSGIESGRTNVCALFRRRPNINAPKNRILFEYLRASGLTALANRLEDSDIDPESHVGVAGIQFSKLPDRSESSLRLGDAYSVIPPFTGNGMSIALESAAIAATPLIQYAKSRADWTETKNQIQYHLHQRFTRRLRVARILHPWLHKPVQQSILSTLAQLKAIPFQSLYKLTH